MRPTPFLIALLIPAVANGLVSYLNRDSVVNVFDLFIFADEFGQQSEPEVPETPLT